MTVLVLSHSPPDPSSSGHRHHTLGLQSRAENTPVDQKQSKVAKSVEPETAVQTEKKMSYTSWE